MPKIKQADVKFLSLCKRGKNRMKAVYKADDGSLELEAFVVKSESFEEKGELYAVVYAPGVVDKDGDFAESDAIRGMAHSFMRNGAKLDVHHDGKVLKAEQAYVAESFTIQKGDPRFADQVTYDGKPVDVTGGWGVVLKVDDTELRKKYGEDGWSGVSLAGTALMDDTQTTPAAKADQESSMNPEQLAKAVADALAPINARIEELSKAIKPEQKPAEKPAELDKFNIEQVRAYRLKLQKEKLLAEVDWEDDESVAAYEKKLAELAAPAKKAAGPAASRQGEAKSAASDAISYGTLTKAEDIGSREIADEMLAALKQPRKKEA